MASIITATVSSGLTQQADNSGVLQLASGTGNLVTVPSVTGTAMVSGNMPAFSAYTNTTQALSAATATKINFTAELFDTNNNFASSRFTPTVAGYYQLTAGLVVSASNFNDLYIRKNGSDYQRIYGNYPNSDFYAYGTCLIYLNGTTDYAEVYMYSSGAVTVASDQVACYFSGVMVRSA
jgi:hypothetical protein